MKMFSVNAAVDSWLNVWMWVWTLCFTSQSSCKWLVYLLLLEANLSTNNLKQMAILVIITTILSSLLSTQLALLNICSKPVCLQCSLSCYEFSQIKDQVCVVLSHHWILKRNPVLYKILYLYTYKTYASWCTSRRSAILIQRRYFWVK